MNKIPGQFDGNISLNPEDMRRLVELRTSLSQVIKAIGYLQGANITAKEPLLNWPEMFSLFSNINRLTDGIHNSFKEITDEIDDDGNSLTKGDIINQLRVFPKPPFNAEGNWDFLDHTLRITPTYEEIVWEDERLRAVSQFCRVDPSLDVGHSAKAEEEAAKKKKSGGEDDLGALKRVKVDMYDEGEYAQLWSQAAFYSVEEVRLFSLAFPQFAQNDPSSYDFHDNDDAKIANLYRELGVTGETPEAVPEPPAEPQSAALPLGAMLKFMSTGVI